MAELVVGRTKVPENWMELRPGDLDWRTRVAVSKLRQQKIERALLSGFVSEADLARQFHCAPSTIRRDIRKIERRWAKRQQDDIEQKRAKRLTQLSAIMFRAANSFEKSTQPAEITRTRSYIKDGKPVTETVTERRGQAGDASLLNVMLNAVKESATLEGLRVEKHEHKVSGSLGVAASLGGRELEEFERMKARARQLDTETLTEILKATAPLSYQPEVTEDDVIESTAKPHEGNGHDTRET